MNLGKLGYVIATAIQALSTFAFLALATRILGPAQYGHWALIEPLLLIGGQVALLGLTHGAIKLIAQDGRSIEDVLGALGRIGFWASIFVAMAASALLGYLLELGHYAVVLCLIFIAEGQFSLLTSAFRGAGQTTHFTVLVACRAVISVSLMAIILNTGLKNYADANSLMFVWLAAILAAIGIRAVVSHFAQAERITPRAKKDMPGYKHAIAYGAPILTASVLSAVLANADRYVLAGNVAAQGVTQYVVAGKIAAVLNLCITPMNLWWPTARFQHLNDADSGRAFFSNAGLVVCTGLSAVCASIFAFAPELLTVLAPSASFDPLVTGLLCLATLFIALTGPLNIGGLKQGKTHWLAVSVFIAAAAQIALAFALIPLFGLPGAALATMLSSLLSLAFQNQISQRIHPVPFKYVAMLGTACLWATACVVIVETASALVMRCLILIATAGFNFALIRRSAAWSLVSQIARR